jgi:glutamine synthetase
MNQDYQGGQINQPQINATTNLTVRLEYVWLDGHKTKNLRSKVRYEHWQMNSEQGNMSREQVLSKIPQWNFDGSSTKQANTKNSDVVLHPVRVYNNPLELGEMASFLILCETYNPDGTPHETNMRDELLDVIEEYDPNKKMLFGIEQEYTILDDQNIPVGWNKDMKQGNNYCGIGSNNTTNRLLVEQHAVACMEATIQIAGTNAEVLMSQWEYQLEPSNAIEHADDLWMSRYILQRLSENTNGHISFHPKPVEGEWNGAGAHINFSTQYMRETPDQEYIENVCNALCDSHDEHMEVYGEENEKRLTGTCETQHYDKFSFGVGDRGASVRIPTSTAQNWSGHLEDRRPAANIDPYESLCVIIKTVSSVKLPETVQL